MGFTVYTRDANPHLCVYHEVSLPEPDLCVVSVDTAGGRRHWKAAPTPCCWMQVKDIKTGMHKI